MSIWAKIYNTYNFIRSQNDEDITKFIVNNINSDRGFFLNRIGGSDFDVISNYFLNNNDINKIDFIKSYYIVCNMNGYFDNSTDENERKINFSKFIQKMLTSYLNSDA
jgi:hypothetical protein